MEMVIPATLNPTYYPLDTSTRLAKGMILRDRWMRAIKVGEGYQQAEIDYGKYKDGLSSIEQKRITEVHASLK